jgi:hypothetical protein
MPLCVAHYCKFASYCCGQQTTQGKGGSVMKLKHVCRLAPLILATFIPGLIMMFVGANMQLEESVESYVKRRDKEKEKQ